MHRCTYCNHVMSPSANKCPNCGETNSPKFDYSESSGTSDESLDLGGAVGLFVVALSLILGLIFGVYFGFNEGGVGGAILFGILGPICGVIIGVIAFLVIGVVGFCLIVGLILSFIIWLFSLLWGLGKPL